jgi:hypothetical protein
VWVICDNFQNVLPAFKTFVQLQTNGQSVDALQRAKDNDPLLFKECGELLAKSRCNDMGSDIEQLLKAPVDRVNEYKDLFQVRCELLILAFHTLEWLTLCY